MRGARTPLATLTLAGRVFELYATTSESQSLVATDLPSRDPEARGTAAWSASVWTHWFPPWESALRPHADGVEVWILGRHCKDDSSREHRWVFSTDGKQLSYSTLDA